MNSAVIVTRPSVSLSHLREIAKVTLCRDLTTNIKGQLESLATYAQLIHNDEYKYSPYVLQLLDYTFVCVMNCWTYDSLRNGLHVHGLTSFGIETIKENVFTVLLKGSLFGFNYLIKMNSSPTANSDMLELMNNMMLVLENEGLGRIFNDVVKEKQGNLFYLKAK